MNNGLVEDGYAYIWNASVDVVRKESRKLKIKNLGGSIKTFFYDSK
ncbi:MAG: hypothetical protein ACI8WT_003408 [Clostridium sp.]|jgi:hypothetical protein